MYSLLSCWSLTGSPYSPDSSLPGYKTDYVPEAFLTAIAVLPVFSNAMTYSPFYLFLS